MNLDLARTMVRTAFESGALLQALLAPLKEQCSSEEYRHHAHQIAEAIDKTNVALISSALHAHPSLETEMDEKIRKTGHYR